MVQLGRAHAMPWHPLSATSADDIVVQVTDILYEYLPPNSGVAPELAVERVRAVVYSEARMAAYAADAMRHGEASANEIVTRLTEVLDAPSPDPRNLIGKLLEVVDGPLALEVYDREMERRQPREIDTEDLPWSRN